MLTKENGEQTERSKKGKKKEPREKSNKNEQVRGGENKNIVSIYGIFKINNKKNHPRK